MASTTSLTKERLLQRARDLVPMLRDRAVLTEQLRQIPPETVQDLKDSSLLRISNPERFGGIVGVDYPAMFEVAFELGRGCGSSAWCYAIWSIHTFIAAHFSEEAQKEFWSTGFDTLASSSFNPTGKTTTLVDGGYRISGNFEFSSGCDAASWIQGGAPHPAGGSPLWILVPRRDYTIVDNWYVSGLRGTGSKTVVMDDVFVPTHRTLNPAVAGNGEWTAWEMHRRASYRIPLRTIMGWDLVAPMVGIAQGAIDEFIRRTLGRKNVSGNRVAESPLTQVRLAEASASVDAARVLFLNCINDMMGKAERREDFSVLDRARFLRDRAFVVQLLLQGVNKVFEGSGGHAIYDSEAIQRHHRDAIAVSHRDGLTLDAVGQEYGRVVFGLS